MRYNTKGMTGRTDKLDSAKSKTSFWERREKIFEKDVCAKELLLKVYKELLKLSKKTKAQ